MEINLHHLNAYEFEDMAKEAQLMNFSEIEEGRPMP